ncbi:MAG: hypothetical protein RQ855_04170 [Desulfurococcales archaeon]|jgi:hypothetical protein|nr:hypothetical protein [Desulfurococcales archaeon]
MLLAEKYMDLGYTVFEGKSKVNIELSGGILDLEARIPSSVGVMYRLDKVGLYSLW